MFVDEVAKADVGGVDAVALEERADPVPLPDEHGLRGRHGEQRGPKSERE